MDNVVIMTVKMVTALCCTGVTDKSMGNVTAGLGEFQRRAASRPKSRGMMGTNGKLLPWHDPKKQIK